jgi:hypothetical protein
MLSKVASADGPPWKGAVESPAKLFCRMEPPEEEDAIGTDGKSVVREHNPNLLMKNFNCQFVVITGLDCNQ